MEVHKHPHHVTHKKKWGEYLLEFFMLFFAVFLGFVAENIREHAVEKSKEKEYAKSLYDDLLIDTAIIQRTLDEKIWTIRKLDSLQIILNFPASIAKNNELIYYFERFLSANDVFTSQDVTYRQLLSSGNFRYFKNIALYKKISNYYNLYDRYNILAESRFGNPSDLHTIEAKLFNPSDLNSLLNSFLENFYTLFKRPERKFTKLNMNKDALNLLNIKLGNVYFSIITAKHLLRLLKTEASELTTEIQKEYHLKNY